MSRKMLEVIDAHKDFVVRKNFFGKPKAFLKAVDGVSVYVNEGEIVGLVGESGCGKSTLGRVILKLLEPTSGKIVFDGNDISGLSADEMIPLREQMQLIFQDPYASLNPRKTVFEAISAPLKVFGMTDEEPIRKRVLEMMHKAGLTDEFLYKYPHEMSGGQRQRVIIARAMILNPKFVVCDEPVSALDVSVRAQILNLMRKMQQDTSTSYLFISHDLSVVRYLCDRIYVMYLGKIVEEAPKDELFSHPVHPYTKALLDAIPLPDVKTRREKRILQGDVPSPMNPPSGCRFHPRCPFATEKCVSENPALTCIGENHFIACWNFEK